MAGYIGTKSVLLSTTAANVGGDADIGGALTVGGAFTSQGIDDNATSTAMTLDGSGNVGIGTSSPTFTSGYGGVHIANDYAEIHLTNSSSGSTASDGFKVQQNSANNAYLWNYENAFIAFGTNNSERMRLDSAGRVTKPYQPSFRAYRATAGNVTYGAGNIVSASMTSTNYNVGGHYNTSNGRFTAPIAGRYLFWCALYNNSSLSGRRIRADINGGAGVWGQNQSSSGSDWTASGIADLSTGDYVHMVSAYSDTVVFHDVNHSIWGGYLIG